jgi:hypothetical protein
MKTQITCPETIIKKIHTTIASLRSETPDSVKFAQSLVLLQKSFFWHHFCI